MAWGCCFLLAACARSLRRLLQLPALLCCEAMVGALSFLAFPLRMLTAVDRERKVMHTWVSLISLLFFVRHQWMEKWRLRLAVWTDQVVVLDACGFLH